MVVWPEAPAVASLLIIPAQGGAGLQQAIWPMQVLCSITCSQPDSCAVVTCRPLVIMSEANEGAFMTSGSQLKLSLPLAGLPSAGISAAPL